MEKHSTYQAAVKIGPATVGIQSNSRELLPVLPEKIDVKSLLTDFHSVQGIPFSDSLDGYICIHDCEDVPAYTFCEDTFTLRGPLQEMAHTASDPRYSLWGNQGLLYRLTLLLLEKKHRIYSFHACALYQEEKDVLFIILGGAGSGKTVYLLSGISHGLKLFSTETVHLQITKNGPRWHMGSLVDNIRLGTLWYDFPEFKPDRPKPALDRIWQEKMALDLSAYQAGSLVLQEVTSTNLLFPRIEDGRKGFVLNPIRNKHTATKQLCDNISEKITQTFILYDRIAVTGFDRPEMAQRRLDDILVFTQNPGISRIASVLSNPDECWGDLLK